MGMLIKKGIPYSGSSNSAKNIKFDNKNSELTSGNVQTAIDELSEKVDGVINDSAVSTESTWSATKIQNTIANISVSGGGGGTGSALTTGYDNSTSGLQSTSVQGAIDELDTRMDQADNKFLPLSGGELNDNLRVNRTYLPMLSVNDTTQGRRGEFTYNVNEEVLISNYKNNDNRSLLFLRNENNVNNLLQVSRVVDGQWSSYNVYGEHNKPTASDVGAMPAVTLEDTDYNTLNATGYYELLGNCPNNPYGSDNTLTHFFVIHFHHGVEGWDKQMAHCIVNDHVFYRSRLNGVWSDWSTHFLPLTGGKLDGGIEVHEEKNAQGVAERYARFWGNHTDAGMMHVRISDGSRALLCVGITNEHTTLAPDTVMVKYNNPVENTWVVAKMYGEHNITASNIDIGAWSALTHGCIYQVFE